MIGALLGTFGELTRVQEPASQQVIVQGKSPKEILSLVRSALGTMTIIEKRAMTKNEQDEEDAGFGAIEMLQEAARCTWKWCLSARVDPEASVKDAGGRINATLTYLSEYRLSDEDAAHVPAEHLDCNDHAERHCLQLKILGLPMYLFSIWPKDPSKRLHEDWHEMAVCKLGEDCFLILDNDSGTLWHGTLESFVAQYGECDMEMIAITGLSPHLETVYRNGFSKLLTQILHGISVDEMRSLNVRMHEDVRLLAAR